MAFNQKPNLTLKFVANDDSGRTKEITFQNVKSTPVEADINSLGDELNSNLPESENFDYAFGYYTYDSIVATPA